MTDRFAKKVQNENPELAEFVDMHASFYEMKKGLQKGREHCRCRLKKFPKDESFSTSGACFEKMGDRDKAISKMKKFGVESFESRMP